MDQRLVCVEWRRSVGGPLGYADDMDLFMQANSGLYRRIGYTFDFSDYTPGELAEILNSIVRGAGFKLAPQLSANHFQRLGNVIEAHTLEQAREMMNGGLCERLFDFAKQSLDAREAVVSATNPSLEITEGDIVEACRRIPPPPARDGRRDARDAGDQTMLLRRTEAQLRTAKSEVQRLHAHLRAVKAVSAQNVAWKDDAMPEYSFRFWCRYSLGCLCHFSRRAARACSEACRCPKRSSPKVGSTPVIQIKESDSRPELLSP